MDDTGALEEILRWTTCRDGSAEQDETIIREVADIASQAIADRLLKDAFSFETKYPCPICGEEVTLTRERTENGRLIGSCLDAFTVAQWLFDD